VLRRIRAAVRAIDPAITILQSGRMSDTLRSATSLYETLARVIALIGALAVSIEALGVYGLVAYIVRHKRQEIGVRTALGAPRGRIVGHFLRHGIQLAAAGIAVGVTLALGVSRLMTTVLFGVAATDLTSFTAAAVVVWSAALLASLVPAWRAATADPVSALRQR